MSTTATSQPLTPEQDEFFREEGYLVVEGVLGDDILDLVIGDISCEIDRRARELHAEGEITDLHEDKPFETRLVHLSEQSKKVADSIWNGTLALPSMFELIRYPRLLDVAEYFCGPEIIASSVYRLRPKLPSHKRSPVPWHQDSGYFEPFCDDALVLTVWLPLVDATEENGCLWVIPKSHRLPVLPHGKAVNEYLEIRNEDLPKGEWVCAEVPKGGVLLLTNRTVHGSFDNHTDIVRWSMDLRYQSASLPTNAKITRLEGEAVGAEGGEVPTACYPPEADFLIRSEKRPDEVVQDAETFAKLRSEHQGRPVTDRFRLRGEG